MFHCTDDVLTTVKTTPAKKITKQEIKITGKFLLMKTSSGQVVMTPPTYKEREREKEKSRRSTR
jgi:hypothetical protein